MLTFAWPWMLVALAVVPLVVLWYRRLQRARAARRAELAALGLVSPAPAAGWRRTLPPALLLGALVLLLAALGILRRRSLVVVVSDFQSEPGWQGLLGQLARRHDVVAIQVVDRREFELPAAGMIYVEDAETGEVIFVDTDDPGFRRRLAAAADERQAALLGDLRSAGLDLHPVATDDDLVRALFRITHLRRRARSGTGRC